MREPRPHLFTWPVFVEDWQQECCGEPFEVGDSVAWTLLVVENTRFVPADTVTTIPVTGELDLSVDGRFLSIVRTKDGVVAAYNDRVRIGERALIRGVFMHEHHGRVPDRLAPTRGRVERIRRVTQRFERVDGRTWTPVAGTAEARDPGPGPAQSDRARWQTGLLVDLAV